MAAAGRTVVRRGKCRALLETADGDDAVQGQQLTLLPQAPPPFPVPSAVGVHTAQHVMWPTRGGVLPHPAKVLPRGSFSCTPYLPRLPAALQRVVTLFPRGENAPAYPMLARGWTWVPPKLLSDQADALRDALVVTPRQFQASQKQPAWMKRKTPAAPYGFSHDVGHTQGAAPTQPRTSWPDGALPMYRNIAPGRDVGGLWVPRGVAWRMFPHSATRDRTVEGAPLRTHCDPTMDFLPHIPQRIAHDAVLSHWERAPPGGAACLVLMPCGYGKSITALRVILRAGRRALWIVPRNVLAADAADTVGAMFPGAERVRRAPSAPPKTLRVAVLDGSSKQVHPATCDADILVVSVHTLLSRCSEYTPADWESYGTVVVDEAHMMSPRHLHALSLIPARRLLGLSATPYRKNGTTQALYWALGPLVFVCRRPTMSLMGELWEWEGGPRPIVKRGTAIDDIATLTALCTQDHERLATVIAAVLACIAQGRCVLVMGARVAYLKAIAAGVRAALGPARDQTLPLPKRVRGTKDLSEDGIVCADGALQVGGAVCMHSGTPVAIRQAVLGRTPCVCAHPGIAKVGLSCPQLDTIVMATPLTDPEQIVGRITRANSQGKVPLVIDIVDPYNPYRRALANRLEAYKFLDMEMRARKIERQVTTKEAAAFIAAYDYAPSTSSGAPGTSGSMG